MSWLIIVIYSLSLLYIFLFSLGQLHLTWIYARKKKKEAEPSIDNAFEPMVTVQLPIYNEKYVVERLLDAVSKFDYPKDKLEIQVLDDSTDETTAIVLRKLESLRSLGLDIKLIHREDRGGFKAGALDLGLQSAKGNFIAIFDADFLPQPSFIKDTIHYFVNPEIGVVQTRWGHINKDYSILTQLQAFGLDAHFSIEQSGRSAANSFINFNGTCGVWRKKCIEDAGGWNFDTLTEDLDLSYRAQLKGWKFKYVEDVETPGELPVVMQAIKSQQYRWNKGGAETARKNFGQVFKSKLPAINKVHAFFHLFNSSVFVCLLTAALLSVPVLYIKNSLPGLEWIFDAGVALFFGFLSITLFYWISAKRFYRSEAYKFFFKLYPRFLIVSMGLSLHNAIAVIEGFIGKRTPFIRTPKFNIKSIKDSWKNNEYLQTYFSPATLVEGLLSLYFLGGILLAIYLKDYDLVFFHVLLMLGYGGVFYYSVKPRFNA
ncbi:MAG TPA: glycosyltransferase family 2 protein [Cyclobacteriaceae bacterium]|nr:glycosyltransferase family 2 protein [Cyclobacteriaceae bacterium]